MTWCELYKGRIYANKGCSRHHLPYMHLYYVMKHSSNNGCLSLQHRIPFQCWEGIPNLVFCMQVESWHKWNMTRCEQQLAHICSQKLVPSFSYIKGRLWSTSAAMHVSRYIITSHFHRWEGTSNLVVCMHFESWSWQKWHDVTRKGLIDAIRSFPHLPYASKDCDETLQQQWMSLVAAQYPIHMLRGYPNSVILYVIWELKPVEMTQCEP